MNFTRQKKIAVAVAAGAGGALYAKQKAAATALGVVAILLWFFDRPGWEDRKGRGGLVERVILDQERALANGAVLARGNGNLDQATWQFPDGKEQTYDFVTGLPVAPLTTQGLPAGPTASASAALLPEEFWGSSDGAASDAAPPAMNAAHPSLGGNFLPASLPAWRPTEDDSFSGVGSSEGYVNPTNVHFGILR